MPTSDNGGAKRGVVLLDTSAAIAFCQPSHAGHRSTVEQLSGVPMGLSGHAAFETYSVLTRLPAPQRLTPAAARRMITVNFPHTRYLGAAAAEELADELTVAKIAGGSTYDALVAAAAREHALPLITRDRRAAETYNALRVTFDLLE